MFEDEGETYWKVLYEHDMTEEEFDVADMTQHVVKKIATPSVWNGSDRMRTCTKEEDITSSPDVLSHAGTTISAPPEGQHDPYGRIMVINSKGKTQDPTAKLRIDIDTRRNVKWIEDDMVTRNARVIVSEERDNFLKICDKAGIPTQERPLYDRWLGIYFGPKAPKPPKGGLGVRYMSPWEGERRKHPLPTGSKFPMPEGDSWIQSVQEQERRSRERTDHHGLDDHLHGEYATRESESTLITRALKTVQIRQHQARKASSAAYNGGQLIPLASKAKNQDEFDDLAFFVNDLAYIQARARPVTVVAWKKKMDSLGLEYSAKQLETISSNGRIKNPFTMDIAKHRPDYAEFVKASKTEWDNIEGRNTFGPFMKLADIRAQGISQSV